MKDILPRASVAISIPPAQFFDGIMSVAYDSELWSFDRSRTPRASFDQELLEVEFKGESKHSGLKGLMISSSAHKRISIEVRASRWFGEDRPSYDVYVEALDVVFRSLLKAYNKWSGFRYRLQVESREKTEPRLPPTTRKAFEGFVSLANKSFLHPYDWSRFYLFVRRCHVFQVKLDEVGIQRLLERAGFSESDSTNLATIYLHLRRYSHVKRR